MRPQQEDKKEWHPDIPQLIHMLKARGIGYSIIYDAGRVNGCVPTTDAGWIASAKANVVDWEATGLSPHATHRQFEGV
jgi:hypothetical protein